MTAYPEALANHLGGDATTVCHCWRLTRKDGVVKGFADHDRPLTVDGTLFEPESGFSASEARDTLGLAVDTVDVEGALSSTGIVEADIAGGLYDDARVETLLVNWRSAVDFARLRTSTIGKVTRRDHLFVAELKSLAHTLDQINGRYVMRACDAELGDSRCSVVLAGPTFTGSGSVTALSGDMVTVSGLGSFAAGWFSLGEIEWTDGPRSGRKDRVLSHRSGPDNVILALRADAGPAVSIGDGFVIRAGCDKAFPTCKAKFANALNFRGFPHLPGNDAAYGYVVDGLVFDGGPLVP